MNSRWIHYALSHRFGRSGRPHCLIGSWSLTGCRILSTHHKDEKPSYHRLPISTTCNIYTINADAGMNSHSKRGVESRLGSPSSLLRILSERGNLKG